MEFEQAPARAFFFVQRTAFEHVRTNIVQKIVNKKTGEFRLICLDNSLKPLLRRTYVN